MTDNQECDKAELVLGINSFDKPAEASGAEAWTKLITNLIFMSPGTMPTDPDMGCDISQYEFMFIDDKKSEIEQKITEQARSYHPDVPLDSVNVYGKTLTSGEAVLIIQLTFICDDENPTAVIAAIKQDGIIQFDVAI